jgi:succinyl-diaminopimelate desuccinylase
VLHELAHGRDECGPRELVELCELLLGIDSLRQHGDDEAALELTRHGLGLTLRHDAIMPAERQNPGMADAAQRLAERTLELVDVPSESLDEAAVARVVAQAMPWPPELVDEETLFWRAGDGARPLVLLAGHLDTVPAQRNIPGRIEDGAVHGLGASDMKGGLAVMIELARALPEELGVDVGFLFFPREEVGPELSPLPAILPLLPRPELVVMLEPTDNQLHAGCLGNVNARLTFRGVSAHSARPWTGRNAIHEAVRGLRTIADLEPVDVEVEGLVFREVVSAVRIAGGIAQNVIPAEATVELNFRFAPGRDRASAEARLRELVAAGPEVEILSFSPAAPVALSNPLVARLRETGGFDVLPKQAWTPVAQFAEAGLDAINLGPGATAYAHKQDEQIPVENLVACFDALRRFVAA